MTITIKTYNEFLGSLIRKMIADSPVNDINNGSVLLTLLEAVAANDFENNAAILSVLELLNLDVLKNNDLDARGADYGLVRKTAQKASGFVTVKDKRITKRSTGLYPVKPAPIAGSTVLFVNNAAGWSPTGTLYLGRGTPNFEGPINYTSITSFGTFYTIQLASALKNDHLISDVVVDAQGTTDRKVGAGTQVKIPANNLNPEVLYAVLRDAVIPAGEDTVTGVEVVALKPGTLGNAGIGTISNFVGQPFNGATVVNTTSFSNGRDVETDPEFRERIKSYASTLARGTSQAILSAIIGVSDADDSKQVASAVITEPAVPGDPSIIYLDDGSGLEPSFSGQSVDVLLASASGKEEFLQLSNYPLPRPQVINTADGPYELVDQMVFRVIVDGTEEEVTVSTSQFLNITAATASEVVSALNDGSQTFKARLHANGTRLLIYPVAHDAETIQVSPSRVADTPDTYANGILKFATDELSYIKLYQNNQLLHEKERAAFLLTTPFSTWGITTDSNIVISVDSTPAQDRSFTSFDFSGASYGSLNLSDWVTAFNKKFAGLQAVATASGRMAISSNKIGATSSISVLSGTLFSKWFADLPTQSTGQDSNFHLNRQTGNLQILTSIKAGDTITAGTEDAKGSITSSATAAGTYNVNLDGSSRPAEFVEMSDSSDVKVRTLTLPISSTLVVSSPSSNVMRLMASTAAAFKFVQPYDYVYIANRGDVDGTGTGSWLDIADCGLFKVIAKGAHTSDGTNTYLDFENPLVIAGSYTIQAAEDIQAFSGDSYPQIWRGIKVSSPTAESIQGVTDSINGQLINVSAKVFKSNSIKLTSTTERDGSVAIPVSIGQAALLFKTGIEDQRGNLPHSASVKPLSDVYAIFRRTTPTKAGVWLDGRYTFKDVSGAVDAVAIPTAESISNPYGEEISSAGILNTSHINHDSIIAFTKGANKGHHRSIKTILTLDTIGTQHGRPYTIMDYIPGDYFSIMKPLEISPDDSIVFILDQDPVAKTIVIPMSRTGRVNTAFPLTTSGFSADDADNEPGITFSNLQVWGTTANSTEFKDYTIWMRAHNWYVSGGAGSGGGAMIVRAKEYGPAGEKINFRIEHPTFPNQANVIHHENTPGFTKVTYTFGSKTARPLSIATGLQFSVTSVGSSIYRYTFLGSINLTPVQIGDVLGIAGTAGVSANNTGSFSIVAKGSNWVEVYNPNATPTGAGAAEVVNVAAIADVVGSSAEHTVTCVAETGTNLHGKYFTLYDDAGIVAFWFDVNNTGTVPPSGTGAVRLVRIATVMTGDSADTVASKVAQVINADNRFTATLATNVVTAINRFHGPTSNGTTNISGLAVASSVVGVADASLDGKYFKLFDANGSVAVWYAVNSTTPEPLHGASRAIRISSVTAGDSANTVASKTAAVMAGDAAFASVTASTNHVIVTDATVGGRSNPSAATSGFSIVVTTTGSNAGNETIGQTASFNIFALDKTKVAEIVAKVNESPIVVATGVGTTTLNITKATREEVYTPAGGNYSVSLGYGHNPDPMSGANDNIGLFDSETWVKVFQNADPNFTLKKPLKLIGVSAGYAMDTCPNPEGSTGELFKLIPRTLDNLNHHFTQKALSQLPIVSDVSIVDAVKKVQIKSKFLGSTGAVEVVGGRANQAVFNLIGDAQRSSFSGTDYIEAKIDAFPNTLNIGSAVKLQNPKGVKRLSRLGNLDKIDVTKVADGVFEYRYDPKTTNVSSFVRFSISDVSGTYSRPSGTVWRWTHNDAGSVYTITDKATGLAAAALANKSDGFSALNLEADDLVNTVSGNHKFRLSVSGTPAQADYFTFSTTAGTTFALWFNVNGNGTPPTGASYLAATNKIGVDILSSDTENQVLAKMVNMLLSNSTAAVIQFNTLFNGVVTQGATFGNANPGDLLSVWPMMKTEILSIVSNGTSATVTTLNRHLYRSGNVVNIYNPSFNGNVTVTSITSATTFSFNTSLAAGTYMGGEATGWSAGNLNRENGDNKVAGLPIIAVNAASSYIDVVNANGQVMTDIAVGIGGNVDVVPTPIIKWNLKHAARTLLTQVAVSSGVATATSATPHGLRIGDTFGIAGNLAAPSTPGTGVGTILSVPSINQFVYATAASNGTYSGGNILKTGKTVTRYKLEKLGFNNIMRLSHANGDTPGFVDSGVAVDDLLVIQGTSFGANNNGRFRVIGLDNDSILFQNELGKEELNSLVDFNGKSLVATWTNSSIAVTGAAGAFENLAVGMWVKKPEDAETQYRQVVAFNTGVAATATSLTLGSNYDGTTGTSAGIGFDMAANVGQGVYLRNTADVEIYEGDCAAAGDQLFVASVIDQNWFKTVNTGTFTVDVVGTDPTTNKPFLRVKNAAGIAQANAAISVDPAGFFLIEGDDNRFSTIREVAHIAIDEFNQNRRVAYLTPAGREYKFSATNGSQISALGKIGFNQAITQGIDGYLYYTGLMRTVQRIIDGFEPDLENYPGRRAIGGVIELLPPLQKRIKISIQVTTADGVNLSEISNQIKSAIVNDVNSKSVGEDVILSEIIVRIMAIKGVQAATFNVPAPSIERVSIGSNEKAFIDPKDISIV